MNSLAGKPHRRALALAMATAAAVSGGFAAAATDRPSAASSGDATPQAPAKPGVADTGQAGTPSADQASLQEVVVTAQRRSEKLQVVPVSVHSLGQSELEAANVTTALDLGKLVPSLSITPNSATVLVFLRGIGSNVTAIGSEASIATYVDGVYYSRLTSEFMRLNNIDHVETLEGPQGTLFGRNASGGLINIITRTPEPGQDLTIDGSVGYGNYNTTDASIYAALGLSPKAALDIAATAHFQNDGWGRNFATGTPAQLDREESARSKLVVDVTDTTRVKITGEIMHDGGTIGEATPFQGYRTGFADGSGRTPSLGFYDLNSDFTDYGTDTQYGISGRIEQDLGFAQLIDTVAYHHISQFKPQDVDFTPLNFENTALHSVSQEFVNELQLVSQGNDRIDYAAGFFFMNQVQKYNPAIFSGEAFDGSFGPNALYQINSKSHVTSLAPYAQARIEIAPKLKLTFGLRYTVDDISGNGSQTYVLGGSSIANLIPGTYVSSSKSFYKLTWKGGLDYQFTDNLFGYVSASRGFKGATYNMLPFDPKPTYPEVLDAYEIGVKSEWLDHKLRVNGSLFYYQLHNPQVIVIPQPSVIATENAGAAEVKGLEVQVEAVPVERLKIRFSGSLLDSVYTSYNNAPFYFPNPNPPFYGNYPQVVGNAAGKRLPYAPVASFNLGGDYDWILDGGARVTVGGNYSFQTKVYFQPDNQVGQSAYGLLDAYVAYTFANEPITVKLWGANLTDVQYHNGIVEFAGPAGDIGFVGAPLTFGIKAEYSY